MAKQSHTPGPCVWCGGKAKCNELRRGNYRRTGDNYQVVCNRCRARGPLIQDSAERAVSEWNRATAKAEAILNPEMKEAA